MNTPGQPYAAGGILAAAVAPNLDPQHWLTLAVGVSVAAIVFTFGMAIAKSLLSNSPRKMAVSVVIAAIGAFLISDLASLMLLGKAFWSL
jgi:cation transport ATPase